MTQETLKIIGEIHRESVKTSLDIQECANAFAQGLRQTNIRELQPYASQMYSCSEARKSTFITTDVVDDMLTLAKYIALFRIRTDPAFKNASVKFAGRRKSWENEIRKTLELALGNESLENKDRYGCRLYVLNKGIEAIYMAQILTNDLIEFFCGYNPQRTAEFIEWLETTSTRPEFKEKVMPRLLETLSHNFILIEAEKLRGVGEFDHKKYPNIIIPDRTLILPEYLYGIKRYSVTPKPNGYQSDHLVLRMPSYSKICPGIYIEFQVRTFAMHEHSETIANHKKHLLDRQAKHTEFDLDEVFRISPDEIGLLGVSLLEDGTWIDEIGFKEAMHFKERHVTYNTVF